MSVLIRFKNSSQGKRERVRRDTGLLSRMLKITGNSSIQFFDFPTLAMVSALTLGGLARASSQEESFRFVGDGYETIMLQMMFDQMKKTQEVLGADENSPFAKSNAERIFQSMQDQAVVQDLAKTRPLGVSDMVVRSLKGDGGVSQGNLVK